MRRTLFILGCFIAVSVSCSDSTSCEGEACAGQEANQPSDPAEETGKEPLEWSDVPAECGVTDHGPEVAALDTTGDSCQPQLELVFSEQGQLLSADGTSCEYLGGGVLGSTRAPGCRQEFDCGGCELALSRMTNERNENFEKWTIFATSDECPSSFFAAYSKACEFFIDPVSESLPDDSGGGGAGGETGGQCSPACGATEYCSGGVCMCPSGCKQGTVCCGRSLCSGDCIGTPCCRQ